MANRRMFRTDFIVSDKFLEMESNSQLLYFHLIGNADDEGFIDNMNSVLRLTGIDRVYLTQLIDKSYILKLEDTLYLVVHWHQHNKIGQGRKVISKYADRLNLLDLVDEVYKIKQ